MTEPESELYDDCERFELMQRIRDAEDEGAHLIRVGNPEILLRRVDEYLTGRCDLAYLAYWKKHSAYHTCCLTRSPEVDAWQEMCQARDLIRRPLNELQQARLKPVRTKIHADFFREKGGE